MNTREIAKYLNDINNYSDFKASLGSRCGNITFSNSGKRGSVKSFTLSLDSFVTIFCDIQKNLDEFKKHVAYNETEWRNLGSEFYTDEPANAMATVQTKPLFTTLSKLIFWSNNIETSSYNDNSIILSEDSLENAINKVEALANLYLPNEADLEFNINDKTLVFSHKELKRFAFEAFKIILDEYGEEKILENSLFSDSKINDLEYTAIKIKPYFGSGNIIGIFENEQNKESLSSSNTPRYFEDNLGMKKFEHAYFSTQWADVENGTLTFKNFGAFINNLTDGAFEVTKEADKYSLFQNNISNVTPLQKIFYGAPGTGKSHTIEDFLLKIPEEQKERITFHPEYDHASFVGGYKPITVKDSSTGREDVNYKFVPQVFTNIYIKAWRNPFKHYYLAIEEINRGNCAEIFGDLFQLLDRGSNYSISPSEELKLYLEKNLVEEKSKKGILGGKMKLPNNLHILASMNTSDQSLFPMDSAFKRRWEWEYIPICYDPQDQFGKLNSSYDFVIDIEDGKEYSWIKFIEKINLYHIKKNQSLGMDKCIGNYFIKPDNGKIISLRPFINKVIFYLWNDVFKDEDNNVFEKNTSYEDFFPIETNGKEKIKGLFERIGLNPIKPTPLEIVEEETPIRQVAEGTEEMGS